MSTFESLRVRSRRGIDRTERRFTFSVAALRSKSTVGSEPVSFGIAIEQGLLRHSPTIGHVVAPDGEIFIAQMRTLSRWFDGSVRWLCVDTVLTGRCDNAGPWYVEVDREVGDAVPTSNDADSRGRNEVADTPLIGDSGEYVFARSKWHLIGKAGAPHAIEFGPRKIRSSGPVRTTIEQKGSLRGLSGMQLDVLWDIYSHASLIRCAVTLRNSRRARHRGGLWDLGDAGSHLIKELAFQLPLAARPATIRIAPETSERAVDAIRQVQLYQDSSGGENWQGGNHVNREGRVPCRFRGYRLRVDDTEHCGLRASPTASIESGDQRISVSIPDFWQEFPKSIRLDDDGVRIGLLPREWDDLHEIQGGEQKTHVFWLCVQPIDQPPVDMSWVFAPTRLLPAIESCVDQIELGTLQIGDGFAAKSFGNVTHAALDGPRSFLARREEIDEYGWRNYGDMFADHEQLHFHGESPQISHYNNQFDMIGGLLRQAIRTCDVRWLDMAESLAQHVIDIDIYHTNADRAAYNGGMFWFTDHYLHAHTSTHRTYSRHNVPANGQSYGGGPGAEHNFTTGLMMYYHLTGNDAARNAVVGLADWVLQMEDGRRTVLGIVDDGPTGLATVGYAKPGRGGANSMNSLLDAWRLTLDPAYLDFCEHLIRRCVHPETDVDKLDLPNLEVSWSYTMFYSSLAKYLRLKEEASQFDVMYAYARRCLLNVGEWMLTNERPYFDQLDKIEFPTETWAAQEFRKANVLRYAARYAAEPDSFAMRRRADELGDRAWSDLLSFDTQTAARAVALVMTEGLYDCVLRSWPDEKPPEVGEINSFVAQGSFSPQRQRVRAALRSPRGIFRSAIRLANPWRWHRQWHVARCRKGLS